MLVPLMDIDDAFKDRKYTYPDFPANGEYVLVKSGGTTVRGSLYLSGGPGAKGTVILTPPEGYGDRLDNMIVPLTYAGIHVITYVPSGRSREGVPYSLPQTVDNLHAILAWLLERSNNGSSPIGGKFPRIDSARVALFGLGHGGGNVSFAACAESKVANYAIGASLGNFDHQLSRDSLAKMGPIFRARKEMSGGEVDEEKWFGTMTEAQKDRLNVVKSAPRLVNKHLLMLGASQDTFSPVDSCHKPMVRALRAAGVRNLTDKILDTDHLFLTKRYALARETISWLREGGF